MIRFFYDATGLAKHIDIGAIYKVFLKKTYVYLFYFLIKNFIIFLKISYNLYKFIYSD